MFFKEEECQQECQDIETTHSVDSRTQELDFGAMDKSRFGMESDS